MFVQSRTYTIDAYTYWVYCYHDVWTTPCHTPAGQSLAPHGWVSSDGRIGTDFFTDEPWIEVADPNS